MPGDAPSGASPPPLSPMGMLGAGFDLVVAVLLFLALGWKLDDWFATAPVLMLGGALLGMIVGFYMFYRRTIRRAG